MKCSKTSWYTAVLTLDLRKHSGPTPADDMAPQTITDCGNFTLDLKQRGFCASPLSSRLWDPDFKGNAKFTFIREHYFGPLSSSPVLFVFSQTRRFWRCLLFKSGLTWTLKPMSCIRLCVVVLEALTPAAVHSLWISPTFFNGFCFTILSRVRLSLLLVHFFSTTSFPSLRLSINVLGHRALWTASLFCNDLLCLALLVQGVNGRLLDNCQVSSLPHDCVAYRTRLRDHLKAFAGVLS